MKRRSISWLLGSCVAYWAALFAVKLGPAVIAIWRATRDSKGTGDNTVGFNVSIWVLNLVVSEHGRTTWSGSIHAGALAAWIAVVPLAIWLVWFMSARSGAPVRQSA
jgi:hypothetical protein